MKTTNFWKTLCLSAVMLTAGAMVSCEPEDKDIHDDSEPYIQVDLVDGYINAVDLKGGDVHFKIESNGDWSVEATDEDGDVYGDIQFLPASGTGGTPDMTVRVGASNEPRDIYLTFTATKVINNRVFPAEQAFVIFQTEDGEVAEPVGIKAIYANNITGDYTVEEAWVVANYQTGFVMTDDSGSYMSVYLGGSSTSIPAVGTKLTAVTGAIEARPAANGSMLQFNNTTTYTADGTVEVNLGEPKNYDYAALTAYGKLTGTKLQPVYVKYTGTLAIANGYYNVNFAEGSDARGSLQGPNADLNVSSFNGMVVDVTGFLIGYSSNGYNINTCVTNIAMNTSTPFIAAASTNVNFEAEGETKNVEFTAGNLGDYKVFASVDGDDADFFTLGAVSENSVSVTAKANTESVKKSATLTIYVAASEGGDAVASATVTLSLAAKVEAGAGYALVTSAPADWSGDYLVAYFAENSDTCYVLKEKYSGETATRSTFTYTTVEKFNGTTIPYDDAYNTITLTAVGDNTYSAKYGSMYIGWISSTNNSCEFSATAPTATNTDYLWTLSIDDEGFVLMTNVANGTGDKPRRLQWNATSPNERFAIYANTQKNLRFFQLK